MVHSINLKEGGTLALAKAAIKVWIAAFFKVIVSVAGLIMYFNVRDWFTEAIGGLWQVGFFEGIATIVIIYYYADKYGDSIQEVYLGLRELGHQRKIREDKK